MTEQQGTGWGIIAIILFLLWWLSRNALGFLHGMQSGDTTVVQSSILGPDGKPIQTSDPTVTNYPANSGCCS
jgi:hypothetical protein